jgi:hypothetical protein
MELNETLLVYGGENKMIESDREERNEEDEEESKAK